MKRAVAAPLTWLGMDVPCAATARAAAKPTATTAIAGAAQTDQLHTGTQASLLAWGRYSQMLQDCSLDEADSEVRRHRTGHAARCKWHCAHAISLPPLVTHSLALSAFLHPSPPPLSSA